MTLFDRKPFDQDPYWDFFQEKLSMEHEENIFFKEQRVNFWVKHHKIPTTNDLIWMMGESEM